MVDGKATVYICENFACRQPVTEVKELRELLIKKGPEKIQSL